MNFKTYLKLIHIGEFILYFTVANVLLFVVFPLLEMPVIANIIFAMFGVIGAFAFVSMFRRKIIARNVVQRMTTFYHTIDNSIIDGISEYFLKKAKMSPNPISLANNIFYAYVAHDYVSEEPFEYLGNIIDTEQAYDEMFYLRVLQIREIMIVRLIEQAQIEEALALTKKQLDYIERMIDTEQVPTNIEEDILNLSSVFRHLIRFIESTNIRTAFAIYPKQKGTHFDEVKWHYVMVRVFLENEMNQEAKEVASKMIHLSGDYRLLERIKEYYNEL